MPLYCPHPGGRRAKMDKIIATIRDTVRVTIRDRKRLIRILSVILILLAAAVLKIHDSSKADIKIESSGPSSGSEQAEAEDEMGGIDV